MHFKTLITMLTLAVVSVSAAPNALAPKKTPPSTPTSVVNNQQNQIVNAATCGSNAQPYCCQGAQGTPQNGASTSGTVGTCYFVNVKGGASSICALIITCCQLTVTGGTGGDQAISQSCLNGQTIVAAPA